MPVHFHTTVHSRFSMDVRPHENEGVGSHSLRPICGSGGGQENAFSVYSSSTVVLTVVLWTLHWSL